MAYFICCRPLGLLALGSAAGLLAGCGWLGDDDNVPYYQLGSTELAWADVYRQEATWRFRSEATGYERTYRLHNFVDKKASHSQGKFSLEVAYYRQELYSQIDRTDSSFVRPTYSFHPKDMSLGAAAMHNGNGYPYDPKLSFQLNWAGTAFYFPASILQYPLSQQTLAAPYELLPQATFNGRTYQQVIRYSPPVYPPYPGYKPDPNSARQIYYTLTEGVVRYVEHSGEAWNRS